MPRTNIAIHRKVYVQKGERIIILILSAVFLNDTLKVSKVSMTFYYTQICFNFAAFLSGGL